MDLTEFTKATVVEWSPRQKCFHVFTVGNMLEHNRRAFLRGNGGTDFIPIGFFPTDRDADGFLKEAHEHRRKLEGESQESCE
jgi:hypothetical protein